MEGARMALDYWLFIPQLWVIIGIIFILLELADGSRIFFLPIGLAGLVLAGQVHLTITNRIGPEWMPTGWHWMLMEWMIVALVISVGLVSFRRLRPKPANDEEDDINS